MCTTTATGQATRSEYARPLVLQRSLEVNPLDAASATQTPVALSSTEAEFHACNRGTAGGPQTCHFLTEVGDSGAWRGIAAGPSAGKAQAQTLGDPAHVDRGTAAERRVPAEVRTDENVVDVMTKHLAAARVEELLSKLGVRRCARELAVASLITRVDAEHFDGRTYHLATVSLAHEVMLLVVECVVLVLALVFLAAAGSTKASARRPS